VEVVASLSQGRTAAAQCGLFTHKSVPVIFEPPCRIFFPPDNELMLVVDRVISNFIFCILTLRVVRQNHSETVPYTTSLIAIPPMVDGRV